MLRYFIFIAALVFSCRMTTHGFQLQDEQAVTMFVSKSQHQQFLNMFPATTDGVVEQIKRDYRIMFYDDKSLKQAMQHNEITKDRTPNYHIQKDDADCPSCEDPRGYSQSSNGSGTNFLVEPVEGQYADRHYDGVSGRTEGIHDINTNLNGDKHNGQKLDPVGQANGEFPWKHTAGLDMAAHTETINFVALQPGTQIAYQRKPIGTMASNSSPVHLTWEYPEQTVVGEMLVLNTQAGDKTFELRLRKKSGGKWFGRVYRPYAKPAQLAEAVASLGGVALTNSDMARKIADTSTARSDGLRNYFHRYRLKRSILAANSLEMEGLAHDIGGFPCDQVPKLLDTAFKPVNGRPWVYGDGNKVGHAPFTNSDCSIMPRRFLGHLLPVNQASCIKCHRTTLGHARRFSTNRDWYGRVRGSDGIFTFHIFDDQWVRKQPSSQPRRYLEMLNKDLINGGFIRKGSTGKVTDF